MIIGTAYFPSRDAAYRYYGEYLYDNTESEVNRKLKDGEIHLGRPPLKDGEKVVLIDHGNRYGIESD